jgi:hypothetical protein
MDPSEEKKQDNTPIKEKSNFIPLILVVFLLATILGIGFYFYSGSKQAPSNPFVSDNSATEEQIAAEEFIIEEQSIETALKTAANNGTANTSGVKPAATVPGPAQPEAETAQENDSAETLDLVKDSENIVPSPAVPPVPVSANAPGPQAVQNDSICDAPALQLNTFYKHLDRQPYMAEYKVSSSSEKHFTALIQKLLANPPQVTRESDDLYTILKNTAHFFRVSGKDNILMMKGILDNEKGSIEQILADYYLLITTPGCSMTAYSSDIDHAALYEYACFFLNTMGGRLYLFRRDSLSRMVVTYYAILLVDQANIQTNNRHGIALKPVVDMLIAEMEAGGSALKHSESYLDKLYDLKEKYQ